MHKTHKASRTIAALFNLSAICIENAIAEIVTWIPGFFNDEDLIRTDANMSISDLLPRHLFHRDGLANGVNDNEIVAGAVHFAKSNHPATGNKR